MTSGSGCSSAFGPAITGSTGNPMPYKDPTSPRAKERRAAARKAYEERARRDTAGQAIASPGRNPHPVDARWQRADRKAKKRTYRARGTDRKRRSGTFIGVDGEGWTEHTCGDPRDCPGVACTHHYVMLVAGDQVLEHGGRPLKSWECIDFLAHLPSTKDTHYVSYFFDYDCTMILRDFAQADPERMRWHLTPEDKDGRPYGQFQEFGSYFVDYVPRKHIRVKATDGGIVTVHDTRSFFQCSFVQALEDFGIGTAEQRDHIRGMKGERATFSAADFGRMVGYCRSECQLLADLVGELRDRFAHVDMSAFPYEGPGPVAGRELTKHATPKQAPPSEVTDLANRAYYGGRFEIAAHGTVPAPVYAYDIRSAYPDAMTRLPCLEHGRWVPGVESDLYVAQVEWDDLPTHRATGWDEDAAYGAMGPLPWRSKAGTIAFPTQGSGWYWSVELPDTATVTGPAWSYLNRCSCQPFGWVRELYEQRAAMEAERKGSGIALKLTLNSLYGKLAQRVGKPRHLDPVWAGLITAMTRRKVYDVYRNHPRKVVMFATDAVFLIEPAPELELGRQLGQWELENDGKPYEDFCVFMPGVYFDGNSARFKTRGVPKADFREQAERFRAVAEQWETDPPLSVELRRNNHLSVRQALAFAQGDQSSAKWLPRIGNWVAQPRYLTADPVNKRIPHHGRFDGQAFWSMPWPDAGLTTPYAAALTADQPFGGEEPVRWSEGIYDGDVTS